MHPDAAAGYLAKYATKSATPSAGQWVPAHLRRVSRTVHRLGWPRLQTPAAEGVDQEKVAPYGRLGQWEDILGFRGRFNTSSRRLLHDSRRAPRGTTGPPAQLLDGAAVRE